MNPLKNAYWSKATNWLKSTNWLKATLAVVVLCGTVAGCAKSEPAAKTVSDPAKTYRKDVKAAAADAGLDYSDDMSSMTHTTSQVLVTVDGATVNIPAGIGSQGKGAAALHTHSGGGLVSMDAAGSYTLSQFLTLWGVAPTTAGVCEAFTGTTQCSFLVKTNNLGTKLDDPSWQLTQDPLLTPLEDRQSVWIDISSRN